jgi:hypothetical protein
MFAYFFAHHDRKSAMKPGLVANISQLEMARPYAFSFAEQVTEAAMAMKSLFVRQHI